jgi:multiple sugar transport system permease protein
MFGFMAGINQRSNWGWVIFFLAPSLLGLLIFVVIPILSSLWYAFNDWNLLSAPDFIGLGNFQELLDDDRFWRALGYTLKFIVLYVPSLIWKWIFNPSYGLLNYGIEAFGLSGPAWLFEPTTALYAMVITSIWKDVGYIALLYLGGLQSISETYYEAARIDGAGRWHVVRHITLPLLSPTMFFVLITLLINYFQMFEQVWLMPMRDSAADRQLEVVVTEVVNNAFRYNRMGYASAMSWVLFAIIFLITFIQLRLQKRWVYYETD